jgi:hypothetical protein
MKPLAERLLLPCGLMCLLAARASAQVVVQGVAPQDQVLPFVPRPESRPWSLRFGVNEVFESNVRGTPVAVADAGSQLDAAIARSWTLQRGTINIIGNAGQTFYRQATSLNLFLYGVGVNASYKVSPRVFWDVSDTLTTSYAQDTTALLRDSGLLPAKLLTHLNTVSSALLYDVSPRTQISWRLGEQRVSFDSSQFGPSTTFTTAVNIARKVSRSQTVGITDEYQRADAIGSGITEGLLGTWQQTIGKDVNLTGTGGIRLYTLPDRSGFRSAPSGSVGFSARVRHDDAFSLRFERFVEQALGNQTHLSDQVWAGYGVTLGRLSLNAAGNYGRGIFPLDPGHKRSGETGTVGARCLLVRDLFLAVGSSFYKRIDTSPSAGTLVTNAAPDLPVTGHTTTISLMYRRTWR